MTQSGGPPEHPTQELPVPDKNEILLREIKAHVQSIGSTVMRIEGDVGSVRTDVNDLKDWRASVDERLNKNSHRAAAMSQEDMAQDAKLADVIVKYESLASEVKTTAAKVDTIDKKQDTQTLIMTEVRDLANKVWQNPKTTLVIGAVGAAAYTWLIQWLSTHGVHIPQ